MQSLIIKHISTGNYLPYLYSTIPTKNANISHLTFQAIIITMVCKDNSCTGEDYEQKRILLQ